MKTGGGGGGFSAYHSSSGLFVRSASVVALIRPGSATFSHVRPSVMVGGPSDQRSEDKKKKHDSAGGDFVFRFYATDSRDEQKEYFPHSNSHV